MRALFCKDTLLRPFRSMRGDPDRWISRLVFLLGPWAALWMVEILNENDVFQDLAAWQVLMNMIWYYLLFALCRLILGRRRRSAAVAVTLCFLVGLLNHYILRFRGRILFPADVAVSIRGAVSPITLDTASKVPVNSPPKAEGTRTFRITLV